MKKFVALMMAALMVLSLAACSGPAQTSSQAPQTTEAPKTTAEPTTEPATEPVEEVLEDPNHAIWTAHGQFLLTDGTENAWNGKDSDLYEKSALTAIKLSDVEKIDKDLYETLKKKDVKYLYTIDLVFGTNDAGWPANFLKDGKLYKANGSYCFKVAQCTVDVDGNNKVYAEDQWISDPRTAYVESLTPDTLFYPTWQEEKDENGFAWDQNPVVIGGAGVYTLVMAQYKAVSAAGTPGYGAAMILKEAKDGIAYEEIVDYVAADHTYGIVGTFNNWGDTADVEMTADGENTWKGEVELEAGAEFKVRADGAWDYSWGTEDGGNFKAEEAGTYTVTVTFDGDGNGTAAFEKK